MGKVRVAALAVGAQGNWAQGTLGIPAQAASAQPKALVGGGTGCEPQDLGMSSQLSESQCPSLDGPPGQGHPVATCLHSSLPLSHPWI